MAVYNGISAYFTKSQLTESVWAAEIKQGHITTQLGSAEILAMHPFCLHKLADVQTYHDSLG
jgi:hypothetical protein